MSKIALNFFGEIVSVEKPKNLASLRNDIARLFFFSAQDAAEILLTYNDNGDKLIISASYNNSMSAINYILFFTTPLYNIDYMSVNIDVTDCLIDLENYKNFNGKYYFLQSQYKYYIKMNAWKNYIT